MTVCGISKADGVCVMGECPYIKMCCPAVWDKSGKPMTNEEYLRSCNTEQLAESLLNIMANNEFTLYLLHTEKKSVQDIKCAVVEWLKQPHTTE